MFKARRAMALVAVLLLPQFSIAQQDRSSTRGPSIQPAPTHTVTGTVRKPNGEPLEEMARVTLKTFTEGMIGETFSNTVGVYEIRHVPNGVFTLSVKASGYREASVQIELFSRISTVYRHDFFLEPEESGLERTARPQGGEKSVSVGELKLKVSPKAEKEYEKGIKASSKGNYEKAVGHLRKAVEISPDFYKAYNDLGAQYIKLNRFDEAVAALERAISIYPDAAFPYLNLGYVYIQKGERAKATEVLRKAISLDEKLAQAHYLLGQSLLQSNELDEAEQSLRRAYTLEPKKMVDARLVLANIYIKRQQHDKLTAELEAYLKENPESPHREQVMSMLRQLKREK